MEDKGLDLDTAALSALCDPATAKHSGEHSRPSRIWRGGGKASGLSDTGMLRALSAERVPTLDDLRLLSGQIRERRKKAKKS